MSEKELKKQKRKEKKEKIKSFFSDKKNKAIVKLCLYFVFFLFVIIYIRIMNSRTPVTPIILPDTITTAVSSLNNNNYEFEIEYKYNDEKFNVTGKKYNDKYLFKYNENTYYYNDDLYLVKEEKELIQSENIKYLFMMDAKKVYNYLYNSTYNYKQEDSNHNITINSDIKLSDFGTLINEQIDSDNKIIFNTIETNGILTQVNIDLSNYIKVNSLDDELSVNITYKNINNIDDFNY